MCRYFTPEVDFVTFDTPEELKEKISYYVIHHNEREKIARRGGSTVKKYDNVNFARTIINKVM